MKRALLLVCLLTAVASAVNDFSSDANCVSVYNFESGAMGADSKGTDTLNTAFGPDPNTTDYMQGAASGDFNSVDNTYLYRDDGNLSAGFPGKSGSGNTTWSAAVWVKVKTAITAGQYAGLLSKYYLSTGARAWELGIEADSGDGHMTAYLAIGTETGDDGEQVDHASTLQAGIWYHIAVTYDDATKAATIRIYDANAAAILGTDVDTTTTANMYAGNSAFQIGRRTNNTGRDITGLLDEAVIFNDVLSAAEIDSIRAGTFPSAAPGDPNTYYVDPNASGADDGSSWSDAFQTLAQGADAAQAGDTVRVKTGTYSTVDGYAILDCNNAGSSGAEITYIGDNGSGVAATVTLDASAAVSEPNYAASVKTYTVLTNFHLKGGTVASLFLSGGGRVDCNNVIIEGNTTIGALTAASVADALLAAMNANPPAVNTTKIEGSAATTVLNSLTLGIDANNLATLSEIGDKIVADMDANSVDLSAILADTGELQTNQGNWLTAEGFSTHAAADVWSVATRQLTGTVTFDPNDAGTIANALLDSDVGPSSAHTTRWSIPWILRALLGGQ